MEALHRRVDAVRQSRMRGLNERARCGPGAACDTRAAFRCECDDPACLEFVLLRASEYETVRSAPAQFVVGIDHENPQTQSVVLERPLFTVVALVAPEGRRVAQARDPRTPPRRTSAPLGP